MGTLVAARDNENDACLFVLFTESKVGGVLFFGQMTYAGKAVFLKAKGGKRYTSHRFWGLAVFK